MVEVVKGMAKNEAPWLDGFIVKLFQYAQKFIGQDVLEVVEDSRGHQKACSGLNATLITLIPKSAKSDNHREFGPIALCNVIYKIIKNIMVKHLNPVFPSLISSEQTSFVEGHEILQGFTTSQEALHSLKHLKISRMMIKLDLSKAYDCIRWTLLIMTNLAFSSLTWLEISKHLW